MQTSLESFLGEPAGTDPWLSCTERARSLPALLPVRGLARLRTAWVGPTRRYTPIPLLSHCPTASLQPPYQVLYWTRYRRTNQPPGYTPGLGGAPTLHSPWGSQHPCPRAQDQSHPWPAGVRHQLICFVPGSRGESRDKKNSRACASFPNQKPAFPKAPSSCRHKRPCRQQASTQPSCLASGSPSSNIQSPPGQCY